MPSAGAREHEEQQQRTVREDERVVGGRLVAFGGHSGRGGWSAAGTVGQKKHKP